MNKSFGYAGLGFLAGFLAGLGLAAAAIADDFPPLHSVREPAKDS